MDVFLELVICPLGFPAMQERGLEPLHLSVLAPKTSASANSATPAFGRILAGLWLRGQKRDGALHEADEFDLIHPALWIVLGGRDDVPFVLLRLEQERQV